MSFKYISLSIGLLLLTACSSSHTDKIKQQLGKNYNEQTYLEAGGEVDSKHRVKVFSEAICSNKYTKEQLQNLAINKFSGNQLILVDAEIKLADKDCK